MSSHLLVPTSRIEVEPLCQSTFSPFGTVIEDPTDRFDHRVPTLNRQAVTANQGTALKYLHAGPVHNLYKHAPSQREGLPAMNLFVCTPRRLRPDITSSTVSQSPIEGLFDVKLLERHLYTTQTFIPMGLSSTDTTTRYLVIVAPTLPSLGGTTFNHSVPISRQETPSLAVFSPEQDQIASPIGRPDLRRLRAFLAHGSQAVTYGAGTWHAPMAVVGEKKVQFVVTQYANGVENEDCEELNLHFDGNKLPYVAVPKFKQCSFEKSKI